MSTITVATQYQGGYERRIPYPSPTPYVSDPVGALHHAVSTTSVVARTPHGSAMEPLFGYFTIDDNPFARMAKD